MREQEKTSLMRAALVALCSSVLVLSACGGGSSKPNPQDPPPVEEPDPVLPPEVGEDLPQVISGAILDAKTGAIIDGATVRFIENGAPATNVTDLDGNTITSATTVDGSFEVAVKGDAGIDGFTVVASASGYLDKSAFIEVFADQDVISAQIELTAVAATVGVAVTEKEVVVENATVAEEIVVDTDDNVAAEDDKTVGSATVAVPTATVLQDSAGNVVTGTAIKLNVAFVEETDEAAANAEEATTVAAAIPAGINEVEDADLADTVSIPLAVAQVNLTATDTATNTTTQIKRFSQPIKITFNLPATTRLRSADRTVAEGDSFRVKSFDEDEGFWKVEPNRAIVGPQGEKGFPAEFEVDHLTFFAVTDGVAACNQPININFSGDPVPTSGLFLRLFSRDLDVLGYLRAGTTSDSLSAAEAKALGVAANATAAIQVRGPDGKIWFTTVGDADGVEGSEVPFCGDVEVVLANPVAETVSEDLTITAVCSNDTTVTTPLTGALVKYRASATAPYAIAPGNGNGTYTLSDIESGAEYSVLVDTRLDGVDGLQTTTITADGTGEDLDVSLTCAGGTGTGGTGGSGG